MSHLPPRLRRRTWPVVVTVAFVGAGTVYFLRWGSVVQHHPSLWISPPDLWGSFDDAVAAVHGHFGLIYGGTTGFLAFPGILCLLAPIAAVGRLLPVTLIEFKVAQHVLSHPHAIVLRHTLETHTDVISLGRNLYIPHPEVFLLLGPYELLLSCTALFACDALAERLGVAASRRGLLSVVEGVVLWNVSVLWGHPEDAVAVGLALYALVFALDGRWTGTGWLFGAAIAMQPLVVTILPILLVMGGRRRAVGLLVRGILPAAVVTLPPLVSDVHATVHTLITQPALPGANHRTPWTDLAPTLGGSGPNATLGGGPVRVVALLLSVVVAWWSRRWRSVPEMISWAVALSLALRCYTESVMTAYYVWPALAVGLVVAARAPARRFLAAVVFAVLTTVTAQWVLADWTWWIIDIAGMTGVLVVSLTPSTVDP